MRIWDISPGYLNRQSLLGEHRELHAIASIIDNGRAGYSKHPETLRWKGCRRALALRHRLQAAEMELRGYCEKSPVDSPEGNGGWPEIFIDQPHRQFDILRAKYREREKGRIPLPENAQQLWAQHKYSVLARDEKLYRRLGPQLAAGTAPEFPELARMLTVLLREPPSEGGMRNAIQHMWGHLKSYSTEAGHHVDSLSPAELLKEVQSLAIERGEDYLSESTALGELAGWIYDK